MKQKRKRKRAPGGGRKPSGPFAQNTAQLTIRMPDDMRARLETAAQKRGWSLTQELLWRLRQSLNKERETQRDPATRAISFLISEIANGVHMGLPVIKWHRNPFMFKAFRLAVAKVLDALAPPGEPQPPYDEIEQIYMREASKRQLSAEQAENLDRFVNFLRVIADMHKTPEDAADSVAADTLRSLLHSRPLDTETFKSLHQKLEVPWVQGVSMVLQEQSYAMSNVRHDLGIDEPKEPKS